MAEQTTAKQSWQEALDLRLIQRLLRPVVQPGLARSQLAGAILARGQGLAGQLPLLGQVVQRYGTAEEFPADQAPIVYARPRPDDGGPVGALTAPEETSPPQRLVVQARAAPPVEPDAVRLRPVLQRAAATAPTGALPVVQAKVSRPAEPGARPDASGQKAVIQRTAETGPTGALPVIRPEVEPSATTDAGPVAGGQKAVIRQAAETGPTGIIPVVQPKVSPPAEPAERPALVARPITVGERRGRPAPASPARPVVAPSRSAGQTGVIQRSLELPVVVEVRRPGWSQSPPPEAFQRPVSVSNRGQPVGQRAAAATVVQRAASGVALSPPVIQRAEVETEVDLEKLAERVQRELDMEALVAKVQRQLKQRLVVESERRGWVQWP